MNRDMLNLSSAATDGMRFEEQLWQIRIDILCFALLSVLRMCERVRWTALDFILCGGGGKVASWGGN